MKHKASEDADEVQETAPETAPENAPETGSGWPVLEIGRHKKGGLVEQIVIAISVMVGSRALRIGTRMPSVRQFAKCNGVSTFTVVESYDRLVNLGLLSSRRGSGYFVARHDVAGSPHTAAHASASPSAIDALTPDLYSGVSEALPVGAGWLPPEMYGEATILDAVRQAMRIPASRLRGYGHPLGFASLRQHLASTLSDELFQVEPDQVLLTHGATHGFDLILRSLTKPGDTVLVEDPGYSNLQSLIRHHGCIPVGIARGEAGLDLDALARKWPPHPAEDHVRQYGAAKPARHLARARRRRTGCWRWPSSSISGWWKTISTANWPRAARRRWRRWTACGA